MTDLTLPTPASTVLADQMTYAKALAASDLLPPAYRGKPANVLVALALGDALGLPPTAALYGINVIQGKPTLSAESMRAVVLAHGHRFDVEAFTEAEARVACARRERPDDVSRFSFTVDDAKRAGLIGGNYDKYPKAMLLARATSQACRAVFPDVLAGVSYTPDELDPNDLEPVRRALHETNRPRAVERLSIADGHIVDGQPDAWTTPRPYTRSPLPCDPDPTEAELVEAELVEVDRTAELNAELDRIAAAGGITVEPQLVEPEPELKLTGPAARHRSHTLAGPATDAQLGKLRALMREQRVSETVLGRFAVDKLGFELPVDLEQLTRGQASKLIDSLIGGAS